MIATRLDLLSLMLLALSANAGFAADAARAEPPNVVLILADDLGWADLGCYGNRFNETPRIDRLAREGLRFSQFYAGPVCSPTRANLQAGQDQARFGITQHIPGHRRPFARLIDPAVPSHLPLEVETFAERLRGAGYATGYFGKWHLGGDGFGPDQQGWETAVVRQGHTVPAKIAGGSEPQRTAAFLTNEAIDFIETHRDGPFVVQVSHSAVHIPLAATPELLAKYEAKPPRDGYPSRPDYAALLEELDQSVGRLVDAIDRLGLAERTLVLFLSDNGGLEHQQNGEVVTSNAPLRGEKGTLYEGGIRVPAIARWQGRIVAGSESNVPAMTLDVYPTLLSIAMTSPPAGQPLDGVSLTEVLFKQNATVERDGLFWHLPHYHHSTPASAIRRGDWKLIEFFEDGRRELYNLRNDPGETTDLAAHEPDQADAMQRQLAAWRQRVGARLPKPNPNYDPRRADELAKGKGTRSSR